MTDSRVRAGLGLTVFIAFIILTGAGAWREARETRRFVVEREIPALGLNVALQLETALGIDSGELHRVLEDFAPNHRITVHLVDRDGQAVHAADRAAEVGPEKELEYIWGPDIADAIHRERLNPAGVVLQPLGSDGPVLWGRYQEERDLFLVVKRNAQTMRLITRRAALRSLASGGLLSLCLFILTLAVLRVTFQRIDQARGDITAELNRHRAVMHGMNRLLETAEAGLLEPADELLRRDPDDIMGRKARTLETTVRESRQALLACLEPARREGSPERPPPTHVSVQDLLQEALLKNTVSASRKKVTIHTHIETGLLRTPADANLIRLALDELFDLVFTTVPEETEILVSAGNRLGAPCAEIAMPVRIGHSTGYSMVRHILDAVGASLRLIETGREMPVYRLDFPAPADGAVSSRDAAGGTRTIPRGS